MSREERLARHFAMACAAGSVASLRAILAPEAIAVTDGGGRVGAIVPPVQGTVEVAGLIMNLLDRQPGTALTIEAVNGGAGVAVRRAGEVVAVVALTVAGPTITAVWIVLNPNKLRHWRKA